MSELQEMLNSCKESSDIMLKVCNSLISKEISFNQSSSNEIIIKNKSKDEIVTILKDKIMSSDIRNLLNISEVKGNTFIRLKFK